MFLAASEPSPTVSLKQGDGAGETKRTVPVFHKAELRNRNLRVMDAKNEVREGIATTAVLIANRQVMAEKNNCPNFLKEIHGYQWDEKAKMKGEERPVKERDHAMDALRYLCQTRTNRFRRIGIGNEK